MAVRRGNPMEQRVRVPALASVRRELARRSLRDFFRLSWPILEPGRTLVWNWHIDAICDHAQALVEGRIANNQLVINVPPGSTKSRIISVCLPAWRWLDHPEWRGIFSSANPRLVVRDSLYTRQIIRSTWYQETFRPRWRIRDDQDTKTLFANDASGFRQAIPMRSSVTGERADGLFFDDPLDAADANSRAAREAVVNAYDQAFANRLNDMDRGTRCIIAQRIHEGDLCGHVLRQGGWDHLCIQSEFEPQDPNTGAVRAPTSLGWLDPRTEAGAPMDPTRQSVRVLAGEKLRLGGVGFAGQHQQRPYNAEGALFKRAYWRYYQRRGATVPELLQRLGVRRVIVAADTALSTREEGNYSAACAIGVTDTDFPVLEVWKDKLEGPDVKKALTTFYAKWGATALYVEGGGSHGGKMIAQELRRDTRMAVIEVPNTTDKITGANAVLPTVEAGKVRLPEDEPWTQDFVESLAGFPRALYDDDVDAFRIGLWQLIAPAAGAGYAGWLQDMAAAQQQQKPSVAHPNG